MPVLISAGKNLGLTYKTTAGIFAYMTGKGMKAEEKCDFDAKCFHGIG